MSAAAYRINERLQLDGEASYGDLGAAVKFGTSYQQSEQTRRYLSYALDNERGIDGQHARKGTFISGMQARLSDSGSVYRETAWSTPMRRTASSTPSA